MLLHITSISQHGNAEKPTFISILDMEKDSRQVRAAKFISLTGLHDELLGVSSAVHHFRSADGAYFT